MDNYDVVIVGAGPAGIALAKELVDKGLSGSRVLLIDMGPDINERIKSRNLGEDIYNVIGIGGAGLFSDGKLHFSDKKYSLFPVDQRVSKLWDALPNPHVTEVETQDLFQYAYSFLEKLNIEIYKNLTLTDDIFRLQELFAQSDIQFLPYESRQIRPSNLPSAIGQMTETLINAGVKIKLLTKVLEININNNIKYLRCQSEDEEIIYSGKLLVLAVGKVGARWLASQIEKIGVTKTSRPIEVGVRVEVPIDVTSSFTAIQRDPQLIYVINEKMLAQTFCTCHGGKISVCKYDDLTLLGGYTDEEKTKNSNFALLVKMNLEGIDELEYGLSIVQTVNILGGGEPIVQRLGDLRKGITTTAEDLARNPIQPTLKSYTLGNMAFAFPKKILDGLLETLALLDNVIAGVNHDSVIVSAPCLELSHRKIIVNKYMETDQKGIYIVGDVAGYESGLIPAMASGILAAHGILQSFQ